MSFETARLSPRSKAFYFTVALLTAITVGLVFHRIAERFFYRWIPEPIPAGMAVIILVVGIAAGIKQSVTSDTRSATKLRELADTILCYAVALDLSVFGFQKFFGMQFVVPIAMLDEPFSKLTSDSLTWAYFGHSYPYTVFLAVAQIVGAILMATKRTHLLGAIVLIPILFNIVLIDYFYSLPPAVMIHAIFLLLACCYFISKNISLLKSIFLVSEGNRNWIATSISLLIIPLLLVVSVFKHPAPYGKFGAMNQNADSLNVQKSILPSRIYFDYNNELVFDFNDYRQRYYGTFSMKGDSMSVNWHYPPNSPKWTGVLLFRDGNPEQLKGTLGDSAVDLRLVKERLSGIRFRDF
ncbi:hypothetical protein WBG78_16150 [Chryseolinea sp. T2]|uniref:hypothetical protein n=1 Tax=Chryseolinea sp. T2 TaxID=3129255 RepID=UPI0030776B59